ncbi:MAG: hypothetical protein GY946_00085 [bacterium]|nr:hypothetical protein [bacterium]
MPIDYSEAVATASAVLLDAIVPQLSLADSPAMFDGSIRDLLRLLGQSLAQGFGAQLSSLIVDRAKSFGFGVERAPMITFLSLFGPVTVKSPYMVNQDGEPDRPVNRILHVRGRGKTPLVKRALTDFGVDQSGQRAAAKLLEHYGIGVNRTSVLRVVKEQGKRAEEHIASCLDAATLSAELDPPAEPVRDMLVELDGCEIRTGNLVPIEGTTELTPVRKLPKRRRETDWRDVRVGLVRPLDTEASPKSFVASLASYDAMATDIAALALLRGAGDNTTYVKVVDGGNGLREALDRKLDGPTILDKPHCRSHLFDAAKEMGLPAQQRHAQVDRWTKTMSAGDVDAVISELRNWRPDGWTTEDEVGLQAPRDTIKLDDPGLDRVRRLVAHLQRFHDAVHYDAFRDARYPVGDGEVESAHRVIPQPRLKLPGTWWLPETINRVLALRVLRENGWWDDFWASAGPVAWAA